MSRKKPTPEWVPMAPAIYIHKPGQTPPGPDERLWKNHLYTVIEKELPSGVTWLSIHRNDRKWPRDWRHFQRIKNEICGPEREAVELYPAESRLMDTANQFHLWVMPEGDHVPLGIFSGRVVGSHVEYEHFQHGARQRPLDQESA